ncbi:MAG TPA: hypothetical protein VGS07_24065 [Thermoanaerobaculia bacterium]|jgi:hypothetical protein|nr:hypothetical protein [Thermoanaerobaculia bacterium]
MTGKKMAAKHTTSETAAPKRKAKQATRSISDRAAEVEANLGGSEPLKDFLRRAGWY